MPITRLNHFAFIAALGGQLNHLGFNGLGKHRRSPCWLLKAITDARCCAANFRRSVPRLAGVSVIASPTT
jgi:hypothetical protein